MKPFELERAAALYRTYQRAVEQGDAIAEFEVVGVVLNRQGSLGSTINRAQLILLDPVRRKKFDDTGTIDEQNPDNAQAMAVSLIVGWISAVVMQASANSQDPCNTNLLEECRAYLRQQLASLKSQKAPIERAAKLMRKVEKRLQTKKQNAILRRALDAQVEAANIPLAQIDDKIRLHNDALKLLDDYGFDVEKRAAPTNMQNSWFMMRPTS